ncbi:exported hypothetical protein [groundwater metagenome]|uniref:Uncharacterized protein n=1 Tax=groundwater metagenome TaxID=717931 RepID=A0A098EB58_9ZZZZ
MKLQKEYLLAIFGIIAFLLVGVAMLVYFGISNVFYFAVAVIVIGIITAVYYVWKSTAAKKNVLWLKASKEKTATETKEIYLKTNAALDKISKEVLDMNIDAEKEMLNKARTTMISLECFTAKYDLIYPKLEKLNLSYLQQKKKDVEDKVNKIHQDIKAKFQKWISEYYKNLNKIIDDAKNVGFEVENFTFEENVKNTDDAIEKTAQLRNKFSEIYKSLYSQVSDLEQIASKRINTTLQAEKILSAGSDKNFYGLSVLIIVKNELNNLLANDVSKLKEEVFNIDVSNLKDGNILSEDEKKELASIMNAVKTMNSSTIKNIALIETKYRNFLKNTTQKIRTNIISSENFVGRQELPEEFKELVTIQHRQSISGLNSELNELNSEFRDSNVNTDKTDNIPLNVFVQQCFENIKRMQAIFEKNDLIRRIIKNYPVIKDMIEKIISQKGGVSVNDLKINYAKEFLIYYKFKNPDKADKVKLG